MTRKAHVSALEVPARCPAPPLQRALATAPTLRREAGAQQPKSHGDPDRGGLRRRGDGSVGHHRAGRTGDDPARHPEQFRARSEEHTSELQSRQYLVCRLLLEKKKNPVAPISFITP